MYATGFYTNRVLWPMQIIGRDGENLGQLWGESPAAYLGITIPGFPNLFCMYGPGTNLAHGGSLIFHSECQMRYITGCLDVLLRGKKAAMEPRQDVHDEYYERVQKELSTLVWASPSIKHSHLQEPGRQDPLIEPVAAGRLLGVDPPSGPRRLRGGVTW